MREKSACIIGLACIFLPYQAISTVLQGQGYVARQVGLSQAVSATGAEGAYGIYYNPAQLAMGKNPEFSMDYAQLLLGLSDRSQLSQSYIGFSYPWERAAEPLQGAGVAYSVFNLNPLYKEDILYGSYSRGLKRTILGGESSWGITLKRIRRSFGQDSSQADAYNDIGQRTFLPDPVFAGGRFKNAWSMDAGWHWRSRLGWSLGAHLADLNEPNLALGSISDRLRRSFHMGGAYQGGRYLMFVGDFELKKRLSSMTDRRLNFAIERVVPTAVLGSFGFRGGLGLGNRSWKNIALGLSWKSNATSIDYGFQMPLGFESVAGSHRMTFSVRFGEAPPEEEIVELYRSEHLARSKTQKELEATLKELERLLYYREHGKPTAPIVTSETIPASAVVEVSSALKKEALPKAFQKKRIPDEFWSSWKLYQARLSAGAGRAERLEILRRILNAYGEDEPAKSEWLKLQKELEHDRRDFELIWKSYQQITALGADPSVRRQSLERVLRRFDASGLDMTLVYHELDRLR